MAVRDCEPPDETIADAKRSRILSKCSGEDARVGVGVDGEIGKIQHRAADCELALEGCLFHAEHEMRGETWSHSGNSSERGLLSGQADRWP